MVWCTCPIRCKGGREVAKKTRAKHRKELRDRELERLVREHLPDSITPLPSPSRKRQRSDDDGAHGSRGKRAKRARENHGSEDEMETPFVRVPADRFPAKINVTTNRLFDAMNSEPGTRHQMIMEKV